MCGCCNSSSVKGVCDICREESNYIHYCNVEDCTNWSCLGCWITCYGCRSDEICKHCIITYEIPFGEDKFDSFTCCIECYDKLLKNLQEKKKEFDNLKLKKKEITTK